MTQFHGVNLLAHKSNSTQMAKSELLKDEHIIMLMVWL